MIKKLQIKERKSKLGVRKSETRFPSELRFDIVSKDWVVIATGRAKKPSMFKKDRKEEIIAPKKDCPFCRIETQESPTLVMIEDGRVILKPQEKIPKNWTTVIIPNKYPAFLPNEKLETRKEGKFYRIINAVGFHEVVITKDHHKHLGILPVAKVKQVIDAYQTRYLELKEKDFVNYIAIFHNHGKEAGASIYHPHSQIITTPLLDIDLKRALSNSETYYRKHRRCIYCEMNKWERTVKKRIIFENRNFAVICPFASKMAFQMIISPKKHFSYFENITESLKWDLAEAVKVSLHKLYKGLGNPAYNLYLHTAPSDGKKYPFYHWHFTILPKTSVHAGFELGVHMEISVIEPEKAAEYLRKQ